MTSFEIVPFDFTKDGLTRLATSPEGRLANWPVVYALFNDSEVYVGESLNMRSRADQHSASASKSGLTDLRIILDDTFNKSACLDLESQLIQLFAADAKYAVRNGNRGIVDSAYFDRATYQDTFAEIIEQLRADGYFDRPQQEILQLDTYKYSPFKSPNDDQMLFIRRFLLRLFHQDDVGHQGLNVLEGGPGTGKTIMAVFLMKMIADIKAGRTEEYGPFGPDPEDEREIDVADLHIPPDFSMALVVPQQSLRTTLQKVFDATIGLDKRMVLTPFQVGKSEKQWDLLLVDEAHRLSRRANQPSGPQNKQYKEITLKLFGTDDLQKTQADWIRHRSTNQLLMLDIHQAIRPGDLSAGTVRGLVAEASASGAADRLQTQMRVRAGDDYIRFTRRLFTPGAERLDRDQLGDYELIFFDSLSDMRQEILEREQEFTLCRLVAGYAWKWASKKNPTAPDIVEEGLELQWNTKHVDWISQETSVTEVGSIHTVQGYDLNFAGVMIGRDLRFDEATGKVFFSRDDYFDTKGKENNPTLGLKYDDEHILEYVSNIYSVLMTRGILGTFVWVADPALRAHLRQFFNDVRPAQHHRT